LEDVDERSVAEIRAASAVLMREEQAAVNGSLDIHDNRRGEGRSGGKKRTFKRPC
jgi:hypothetical protein